MKFAIIEKGLVVNIAVSDEPFGDNWIESETAKIGDTYLDGIFTDTVQVIDPLAYKWQRAMEYPPMADYLDGIVKGDNEQIQVYINACLSVKEKYPKPTEA